MLFLQMEHKTHLEQFLQVLIRFYTLPQLAQLVQIIH
jgi:hypothetical protein